MRAGTRARFIAPNRANVRHFAMPHVRTSRGHRIQRAHRVMAEAYTVNDRTNQLVLDISSRMHGAKPPGDNGCSIAAIFRTCAQHPQLAALVRSASEVACTAKSCAVHAEVGKRLAEGATRGVGSPSFSSLQFWSDVRLLLVQISELRRCWAVERLTQMQPLSAGQLPLASRAGDFSFWTQLRQALVSLSSRDLAYWEEKYSCKACRF